MRSAKSESVRKWGLRIHVVFYVLANLAQVVVWQRYDRDHFFWPMWSMVFWGIGLVFHLLGVYSPPRSKVDQ